MYLGPPVLISTSNLHVESFLHLNPATAPLGLTVAYSVIQQQHHTSNLRRDTTIGDMIPTMSVRGTRFWAGGEESRRGRQQVAFSPGRNRGNSDKDEAESLRRLLPQMGLSP